MQQAPAKSNLWILRGWQYVDARASALARRLAVYWVLRVFVK
jgi:hypothetical protein